MNRLIGQRLAVALALTSACVLSAACLAAPGPQSPTDSKDTTALGEPVEPAVDPAKVAENPVLAVKEASLRTQSNNNLKQLAISIHSYNDAMGQLPGDVIGKDGKPLLSWRVLVAPFIEQQQLYQQFKLDEPWDSEHNIKLLEQMPQTFADPRVHVKKKGYTVYQGFSGPNAVFQPGKKVRIPASFPDGTSNTILLVEASTAVPWTKPGDIPFDMDKDVPDFGRAYGGRTLVAMADGSTRMLNLKKLSAQTLKNAINPNDGNVLGRDWDAK